MFLFADDKALKKKHAGAKQANDTINPDLTLIYCWSKQFCCFQGPAYLSDNCTHLLDIRRRVLLQYNKRVFIYLFKTVESKTNKKVCLLLLYVVSDL